MRNYETIDDITELKVTPSAKIESVVETGLFFACSLMNIAHYGFDVVYIDDKDNDCDAMQLNGGRGWTLFLINVPKLAAFPAEKFEGLDEEHRLNLSILHSTIHEARHCYQRKVARRYGIYLMNKNKNILLEDVATSRLWYEEWKRVGEDGQISTVLENDAEIFAVYLICRRYRLDGNPETLKPYKDKYDNIALPSTEDLRRHMENLDNTKKKRKEILQMILSGL